MATLTRIDGRPRSFSTEPFDDREAAALFRAALNLFRLCRLQQPGLHAAKEAGTHASVTQSTGCVLHNQNYRDAHTRYVYCHQGVAFFTR